MQVYVPQGYDRKPRVNFEAEEQPKMSYHSPALSFHMIDSAECVELGHRFP